MTTSMLLRLLADHLLTLDPVDSGYLVNAARKRAGELDVTAPLTTADLKMIEGGPDMERINACFERELNGAKVIVVPPGCKVTPTGKGVRAENTTDRPQTVELGPFGLWAEAQVRQAESPGSVRLPDEFAANPDVNFLVPALLDWPAPNPHKDWQTFVNELADDLRKVGMAFVWQVKNEYGTPNELWRLPPENVCSESATQAHPKGSYCVCPQSTVPRGIFCRIDAGEVKIIRTAKLVPPPAPLPGDPMDNLPSMNAVCAAVGESVIQAKIKRFLEPPADEPKTITWREWL